MVDNVLTFPGATPAFTHDVEREDVDVPVDRVVEGLLAVKDKMDSLIVIGSSQDGHFYFAASDGDIRQTLYDLESAKYIAMQYGINLRDDIEPEGYEPR